MKADRIIKRVRKQLEDMYEDSCTVYEREKSKKEGSAISEYKDTTVLENIPCRISFSSQATADSANGVAQQFQLIKLFLSPDYDIKPGSKIVVTHQGAETAYQRSGKAAVFKTHQEIPLKLFERWT